MSCIIPSPSSSHHYHRQYHQPRNQQCHRQHPPPLQSTSPMLLTSTSLSTLPCYHLSHLLHCGSNVAHFLKLHCPLSPKPYLSPSPALTCQARTATPLSSRAWRMLAGRTFSCPPTTRRAARPASGGWDGTHLARHLARFAGTSCGKTFGN